MSELGHLYKELIIEHSKKPRNEGELPDATHRNHSYNPFCGDELSLYLVVKDGVIQDVKHRVSGCSISRASASMMSERLKGMRLEEVEALFSDFHRLVTGEMKGEELEKMEKLSVFSGVWNYPARVKCALLAWYSLKKALEGEKEWVIDGSKTEGGSDV